MFDAKFMDNFATAWIDAWNSHDIERILSHYAQTFELSSPILAKFNPTSGGRLTGKAAARAYWSKGLEARPDLHFELLALYKGVQNAVIAYRGLGGHPCAEFFEFDANGLVKVSHAHGA